MEQDFPPISCRVTGPGSTGSIMEYNRSTWGVNGCVSLQLSSVGGGEALTGAKVTVDAVTVREGKEVPLSKTFLEWKVEYPNQRALTFPQREDILEEGKGYKKDDIIRIGNYLATVSLVTVDPKGGIAGVKDVVRGKSSNETLVDGGSGTGARIRFPEDMCTFEDGMVIKVHIKQSSKGSKCVARVTIGNYTVESHPFAVVSRIKSAASAKKRKKVAYEKEKRSLDRQRKARRVSAHPQRSMPKPASPPRVQPVAAVGGSPLVAMRGPSSADAGGRPSGSHTSMSPLTNMSMVALGSSQAHGNVSFQPNYSFLSYDFGNSFQDIQQSQLSAGAGQSDHADLRGEIRGMRKDMKDLSRSIERLANILSAQQT